MFYIHLQLMFMLLQGKKAPLGLKIINIYINITVPQLKGATKGQDTKRYAIFI